MMRKDKIQFEDGRKGYQYVSIDSEGNEELNSIVVTVDSDGTRCRDVYGRQSDLAAKVYGLSYLHGSKWNIVK